MIAFLMLLSSSCRLLGLVVPNAQKVVHQAWFSDFFLSVRLPWHQQRTLTRSSAATSSGCFKAVQRQVLLTATRCIDPPQIASSHFTSSRCRACRPQHACLQAVVSPLCTTAALLIFPCFSGRRKFQRRLPPAKTTTDAPAAGPKMRASGVIEGRWWQPMIIYLRRRRRRPATQSHFIAFRTGLLLSPFNSGRHAFFT